MVFDHGARWSYSEGVVQYGDQEPHPADFIGSLPGELKMLWPTEFLIWGARRTHFRPALVQQLGRRSLLITFEHDEDPAMRQTMVIDRTTGIATRRFEYDQGTILTSLTDLNGRAPALDTTFAPITDWIRPEY